MKINTLSVIVVALLAVSNASAISLGAGPGDLYFGNMLQGGYAKKMMMVNTVGDDDLSVTITPDKTFEDWITFEPSARFTLPAHSRRDFWAILQLPDDIENGNYTGNIIVQASPVSRVEGGGPLAVGMSVSAAISLATVIEVTGKETVSYAIGAITVKDAEINNPIPLSITVVNTGNVKVKPKIRINTLDRSKNDILKTFEFAEFEVMPSITEVIKVNLPSERLDVGSYWAEIIPEFGGKQLLGFNILERGGLGMKGRLIEVRSPVWVEAGEIVKVSALFENTGERIASAKFKGEAYLIDEVYNREKLVGTFESDVIDVGTDELVNISAYFTPTAPGRYSVRGVAAYANKSTPEKGTIVNVLPKSGRQEPVVVVTKSDYTLNFIIAALIVIGLGVWKWQRDRTVSGKMKKGWGKFLDEGEDEK